MLFISKSKHCKSISEHYAAVLRWPLARSMDILHRLMQVVRVLRGWGVRVWGSWLCPSTLQLVPSLSWSAAGDGGWGALEVKGTCRSHLLSTSAQQGAVLSASWIGPCLCPKSGPSSEFSWVGLYPAFFFGSWGLQHLPCELVFSSMTPMVEFPEIALFLGRDASQMPHYISSIVHITSRASLLVWLPKFLYLGIIGGSLLSLKDHACDWRAGSLPPLPESAAESYAWFLGGSVLEDIKGVIVRILMGLVSQNHLVFPQQEVSTKVQSLREIWTWVVTWIHAEAK